MRLRNVSKHSLLLYFMLESQFLVRYDKRIIRELFYFKSRDWARADLLWLLFRHRSPSDIPEV